MSENSLALYDEAIMPATFDGMMKQADVLAKSGLLPQTVRTGAAAAAIMLAGRELGIPPMQSFRTIYVVKGNVSLSAQLMAALVLRAGHSYELLENSNTRCAIKFTRRGGATYTHEFTLDDAKRAGLVNGDNWQRYPKAMLWSRCMSAGIRAYMPDVIMGMYTPEELAGGEGVVVDDTGEVIDVVAKDVTPEPVAKAEAPKVDNNGRTPLPEGKPHWIENPKARAAFWAYTGGEKGLSNPQVYKALGVESIHDYRYSMHDAKADIERWVDEQATQAGDDEQAEPEPVEG